MADGHGSRPEVTVDPVVMAAATVMRLQGIVAREVPGTEMAVVTVGALIAGTKANIIPDDAELLLSVRTFDVDVRARVLAAIERIVRAEAQASGAVSDVQSRSCPAQRKSGYGRLSERRYSVAISNARWGARHFHEKCSSAGFRLTEELRKAGSKPKRRPVNRQTPKVNRRTRPSVSMA